MMIDRLQEVLPHLQYLPPKAQEEIANHIKELEQEALAHGHMKEMPEIGLTEDPAGSLSDLPDDMFEELDKIRHSQSITPPIELPRCFCLEKY